MNRFCSLAVLLALSLGACAAETAKGPESNEPVGGAADSFRSPTEHGLVDFGDGIGGFLGEGDDFHAYDFELSGAAEVRRIGHPKGQFRLSGHQPLALEPSPGVKFLPKNSRSTPKSRLRT